MASSCCVLSGGLYFRVQSEREQGFNNVAKETANLARAFEEHTLWTVKSIDQSVLFLKYQYEQEGRAINIVGYMRDGRLTFNTFLQYDVIDENGDLAVTSVGPLEPVTMNEREHFLAHREYDYGLLYIGKPVMGLSGKWLVQFSRRINKPDGSFGGVAMVSVDPLYFNEFYRQVDLGENSAIVLIGRDYIVRARKSGDNTDVGQNLSRSVLAEELKVSSRGSYIAPSPVDGITRLYSYRALFDYPMVVAVGVDVDEALAVVNERISGYYRTALLISIVILGFMAALLIIALRQKRTEEALERARDNLELEVEQRTQDLYAANCELQNFNQGLEEEIAERLQAEETLRKKEEALRQKGETIRRMAYFDSLTGLPNRAHLLERLNKELEQARRGDAGGTVLFIDLDELKMVNDTYGHSCGDEIIVVAGKRIVAETGEGAFVARVGGDEFIVVLPGKKERGQIDAVADRIVKALGQEHEILETQFHMTASIGIAVYPEDGDTAEEIIKNADNAMYAAKRGGKNCWRFYEAAMQTEAYEKMRLTTSLRYALERGELSLHYQPQMLAADGTVAGFEALLRWNSPEHGTVPPMQFIPLAEQSGLINSIGRWVLREACRFVSQLAVIGWDGIHVAVNISSRQLAADDFIAIVRGAVKEAGIRPRQLELEITESVLMTSLEEATVKLRELEALGVGLSLDDFGTGYSSLTYLRNLPVGMLKIDKTFIDMLATDEDAAKIIGSIIDMAHILDMTVTAEGVETEAQLAYLAGNGCDRIQGYLFSRPVPEREAIKFLAEKNR